MKLAKSKIIGSAVCGSGESRLTSERGLHSVGCVFKKLGRGENKQCDNTL